MGQELTRHPQWEQRLAALIDAKRSAPFEWGKNDCHTFGAEVVKAVTGNEIAVTQPYRSMRGALREARRLGGKGGYLAAVERVLGPPKPWDFRQRGDILLIQDGSTPFGYRVGVQLAGCVASLGLEGLFFERVATRENCFSFSPTPCRQSSSQSQLLQQPK